MHILKQKILNLSTHKKELLKGSFDTIIIKIAGLLIGYLFIMILSRNYGASAVGTYQIFIQSISILGMIILFGFNQSIIRFSAELIVKNNILELILILKKFTTITILLSLIVSSTVYMWSLELAKLFLKDKSLEYIFEIVAFTLPFFAINILFVETIRGLKKVKISEFLRLFFTKTVALSIFLTILILIEFDTSLPIISYSVATILTLVLSSYFLIKYINKYKDKSKDILYSTKNKYLYTSFTMYQSILLIMISNQMVIFILAYYTKTADVGIYNIAFQLAALSTFVFSAVMTITAPKYSEIFHTSSKESLQSIVFFSSKLIFWTSGSIAVLTIIFSSFLMGMFGSEFISGSIILIILSLGNFINAFTGPGGLLLDMTGKQSIRRNITFMSILITLPLSFLFIPEYGAIALAFILLVNKIIGNFTSVYYVKKLLGINLIYIPYWTK